MVRKKGRKKRGVTAFVNGVTAFRKKGRGVTAFGKKKKVTAMHKGRVGAVAHSWVPPSIALHPKKHKRRRAKHIPLERGTTVPKAWKPPVLALGGKARKKEKKPSKWSFGSISLFKDYKPPVTMFDKHKRTRKKK